MMRPAHPDSVVSVDIPSVLLLAIGLFFGVVSIWLITFHGVSPLIFFPSLIAAFTGATHLFKYEVPRDLHSDLSASSSGLEVSTTTYRGAP